MDTKNSTTEKYFDVFDELFEQNNKDLTELLHSIILNNEQIYNIRGVLNGVLRVQLDINNRRLSIFKRSLSIFKRKLSIFTRRSIKEKNNNKIIFRSILRVILDVNSFEDNEIKQQLLRKQLLICIIWVMLKKDIDYEDDELCKKFIALLLSLKYKCFVTTDLSEIIYKLLDDGNEAMRICELLRLVIQDKYEVINNNIRQY